MWFQLENQHKLELDIPADPDGKVGFLIRDDQGQTEAMWYMSARDVKRLALFLQDPDRPTG